MASIKSYNPYTYQMIGEVTETESAELIEILTKAKKAQKEWTNLSSENRAELLKPVSSIVKESLDTIVDTLVKEAGMPITEARESTSKLLDRVDFLVEKSSFYLEGETYDLKDNRTNSVKYQPLGTVACIMPWNHPFTIPFWYIIPALIAGNSVVYKPSELTPFVGEQIKRVFSSLNIPEYVFTTVYGDGQIGRDLSSSLEVNMISFAGSVRVGRKIYREAAENMKKLILENGGKDALIVGNATNREKVADQILIGSLRHAGQLCSSVRRIYIVEEEYESYIELLKSKIKSYKIGNPMDEDTVVGPLKTERQIDVLNKQIEDALAKGGHIVYGGSENIGHLYPPTIIGDATPDMDVVRQETFGPLLPLVKVRDLKQAIEYTNDTEFGLNASIWHNDRDEAIRIAEKIEAGTVTVNMLPGTHNYCTWHGVKLSGVGNILSPEGIRQFTNRKNIRFYTTYDR